MCHTTGGAPLRRYKFLISRQLASSPFTSDGTFKLANCASLRSSEDMTFGIEQVAMATVDGELYTVQSSLPPWRNKKPQLGLRLNVCRNK